MRALVVGLAILAVAAVAALLWYEPAERADRTIPVGEPEGQGATERTVTLQLTGRVLRAGQPAKARVSLWRHTPAPTERDKWFLPDPATRVQIDATGPIATVEADGQFALALPPPGDYVLTAGSAARTFRVVGGPMRIDLVLPKQTHELRGRLTRPGHVRAVLPDGPLPWVATDGAFTLTDLPAGMISVEAVVPGVARIVLRQIVVPRADELVITVPPGGLRGKVVAFDDGAPIADAQVILLADGHTFVATTGADGAYTLPAPREHAELQIRAAGYATVATWGTLAQDTIHRLLKGVRVTGRLVPPLPGARVELRDTHLRTTLTDDAGRFAFDDVAVGEFFYFARANGWLPDEATRHSSTFPMTSRNPFSRIAAAGETLDLEIRMVRTNDVTGSVRGPDDEPVANARVRTGHGPSRFDTVTDADGRYTIEAAERFPWIYVKADGYLDANSREADIQLRPASDRRVIVKTNDGAVLVGARVAAGKAVWWTDSRGAVDFTPPGDANDVVVTAAGYLAASKPLRATTPEFEVVLQPVGTIDVRVVDRANRPVANEGVSAGSNWGYTDLDGRIRLRVPAGKRVVVHAGNARTKAAAGESVTLTVQPEPEKEPATPGFSVRVLDPNGHPVPAGRVWIFSDLKEKPNLWNSGRRTNPTTYSYTDGLLALPAAAGKYTLEFQAAGATRTGLIGTAEDRPLPLGPVRIGPIPAKGEYTVRLPAERRIPGRVLDHDGRPIAGVLVWAWRFDRVPGKRPISAGDYSQYDRTRTGYDGTFTLHRLGSEPVAVIVDPPRGFLPTGAIRATPGQALAVTLARGAQAAVTVKDPSGRPLPHAYVRVRFKSWNEEFREKRPGHWADDDSWSWRTDAKGVARLSGLEPERVYRLRITPPLDRRDLAPEEVQQWTPHATEVGLGEAGTITGVVRDSRGEPRREAYVYARFANGDGKIIKLGKQGRFEVTNVPPGKVVFTASIDGRDTGIDSKAQPVEAMPGARDVVVLIDRPPSVLVRIADWPKEAYASVELRREDSKWESVKGWIRDDGALEIVGVDPEHTWEVFLGPTKDGRYAWIKGIEPSLEVRRVTLERGGEIRGRVLGFPADEIGLDIVHRIARAYPMIEDDGSFVLRGLPPGEWTVRAVRRGSPAVTAKVRTGGTVDLVFE